ncbi:hypothetical protein T01_15208 [Trichinella spiralis]|uniref:Uncharacterized protein n=1 Tax=Trichinella spiralis TaxID=6334 RepID=A0A0V1B8U5_TRISP|nr:hypothetical protein T01_15208 [Trichinella spiralis]
MRILKNFAKRYSIKIYPIFNEGINRSCMNVLILSQMVGSLRYYVSIDTHIFGKSMKIMIIPCSEIRYSILES